MTAPPALEVVNLRFRYPGSTEDVVHVSSLRVDAAEAVLLTGASGSGKSTLLQLIAGLMDPAAGTIRVAGREVHALGGAKRDLFRGSSIGMVFQTFNLLQGFSAAENVMAALMFSEVPKREHRGRAVELLKTVGIETPDREVTRLSIGQQQRVAVARAAATSPAIVLADEPTASLDPDSGDAAMDLIQSTCASIGAALVCTSHDPAMRSRFQRVESLDRLSAPSQQQPTEPAGA
ncbi:MAG: ATP-binding cassette domain-containing protein [Planctomycetota bacterium]